TEVLYYNKTFFTDNGLKLPTHWWCDSNCPAGCDTSLEYVCRKIKEIDPNSVPLGYDSESNWFITMCEQLGTPYTSASGEKFLFDNAENKAFLKKFKEWYNQGLLTTQEIYGAYTSGLFINQDPTTPRSYMSIGSSAGATHQRPAALEDGSYPFEVGIASIPQVDPSNPKVISQGPSVCIFQKDNPQEVIASWLFVKFLTTSVEFQAEFGLASGYMPVLQSVRNEELAEYDAEGKPLNAIATYIEYLKLADGGLHIAELSTKVALDQANAYYVSPAFNGSSAARDQVGMLVENVFLLNKTGAELDAAIDELFAAAIYQCYYSIGESVPQK
ncbi:MAG: extracellular solute-binding protein, partial [Clostridia bacterium]|nr:extracellular solute-binding protein [Clostridia bacterium]